jgi:hypothetical protein
MAAPKAPPKGGKKGGATAGLTRKLGPLPVWAWGAVLIGLYLAYRHFASAGTAAAAPLTPSSDASTGTLGTGSDTSGASGGGSGGGTLTPDTPFGPGSDLYNALLAGLLAGGGGRTDNLVPGDTPSIPTSSPSPDAGAAPGPAAVAPTVVSPAPQARTPATASNFAASATHATLTAQASGGALRFGGVTSVKRLANGATLTTYASGHQVEQAPGKTAYVVKA